MLINNACIESASRRQHRIKQRHLRAPCSKRRQYLLRLLGAVTHGKTTMYPFSISNSKRNHVFFIHMWQQIWKSCSLCYSSHCTISNILKKLKHCTDERSRVGLRAECARPPLLFVGMQLRLVWLRQFQVPVIRILQPNNLKLPTSHSSSMTPGDLSVADGAAETAGLHRIKKAQCYPSKLVQTTASDSVDNT